MTVDELLRLLKNVKQTGDRQWQASCPAHEDKNPSLSVAENSEGRILLYCHKGCPTEDILHVMGLCWTDLFPDKPSNRSDNKQQIWTEDELAYLEEGKTPTYIYQDEDGNTLFGVLRTPDKQFFQVRPVRDRWVFGLADTRRVLYRLPELTQGIKRGETIFLVEGEKDVENLRKLGLTATCNPMGAGKWTQSYTDSLAGADVVVLVDHDEAGVKHGNKVCRSLTETAARVRCIDLFEDEELPKKHGKDVSDWLEAGGTKEELLRLVEAADVVTVCKEDEEAETRQTVNEIVSGILESATDSDVGPVFEAVAALARLPSDELEKAKAELKRRFGKALNLNDLAKAINERKRHLRVVRPGEKLGPGRFFDKRAFIPKRLGDEIMQNHSFRFAASQLWVYRDGVYKPNGEELVRSVAQKLLGEEIRENRKIETVKYIQTATYQEIPQPDPQFINLRNGRLNWATRKLHPHTPEVFDITQLPVEYDPSAECPTFDRYLETTLDPSLFPLVEEILGYCLVPETRFEKAVMLVGEGSNGKSVFLDLVMSLLGEDNVANVPLQELEENRFLLAELFGKLANIFADLDPRALTTSTAIKTITTGDRVKAERKFRHPFEFRPYCKLLFSANTLPPSRDRTPAFYRRWLIIPFEKTFLKGEDVPPERRADPALRDKLRQPTELSGVLNRALNGLDRLYSQEEFSLPAVVKEELRKYKLQNDSVAAFIEECCCLDPKASIAKQTFYTAYKTWCEDQGLRPASQIRVKTTLLKLSNVDEMRPGPREPWHWVGICVMGDKNDVV